MEGSEWMDTHIHTHTFMYTLSQSTSTQTFMLTNSQLSVAMSLRETPTPTHPPQHTLSHTYCTPTTHTPTQHPRACPYKPCALINKLCSSTSSCRTLSLCFLFLPSPLLSLSHSLSLPSSLVAL